MMAVFEQKSARRVGLIVVGFLLVCLYPFDEKFFIDVFETTEEHFCFHVVQPAFLGFYLYSLQLIIGFISRIPEFIEGGGKGFGLGDSTA